MQRFQNDRRLRILISAYECSPELGSEAGVGWGFVAELAKHHDLFVITQWDRFRPAIEKAAESAGHLKSIRFFGIERSHAALIPEVGLPGAVAEAPVLRAAGAPLRLVWSGQHIPGKALPLALRALAQLPQGIDWELQVLGNGKCTAQWKQLTASLGISDRCLFLGWMPREQALERMRDGHVMLITSLRDLTSMITVEALALGLPVVCLDYCGFAGVVDSSCGVRIPVSSPAAVVSGLSDAIRWLAEDEAARIRLAYGALARAADFTWEGKVQVVNAIYRRKLQDVEQGAA